MAKRITKEKVEAKIEVAEKPVEKKEVKKEVVKLTTVQKLKAGQARGKGKK